MSQHQIQWKTGRVSNAQETSGHDQFAAVHEGYRWRQRPDVNKEGGEKDERRRT